MKLMRKFTLGMVAGILLIHFVSGVVRFQRLHQLFGTDVARNGKVLGRALAVSLEQVWSSSGPDHALGLVSHADHAENDADIRWVSLDPRAAPHLAPVVPRELLAPLLDGQQISIQLDKPRSVLATYTPVYVDNQLRGAIEISDLLVDEHRYILTSIRNIVISTGFLVAFSVTLIWILGWRLIGRPMRLLADQAQRVGQSDLSMRLSVKQNDEIGELADAMNRMCDGLSEAHERAERETRSRITAMEQLRHADRLRTVGTLASGIAHELGTPINVIDGYAQIIGQDAESSPSTRENAQIIMRQTRRMAQIIRQLLDFARRGVVARNPTEILPLIQDTMSMIEPLARKSGVNLSLAGDEEPLVASIASGEIQQVLTNVFINGIQAMPGGGDLAVAVRTEQAIQPGRDSEPRGYLRIAVEDTGKGMNDEVRAQVFEPFFTTKDVGEGTGLGLAVAHGIVHDHGGWIDVQSREGKGSRFIVYLPIDLPVEPDA